MSFSDILNLFRQGKGNVRSHMKNLIEMAAVDGNFDDAERTLLRTIAQRNNISDQQLKSIQSKTAEIKFEVPADQRERFHQLYDLIHMMAIDKTIHQEELKLCDLYAIKFGYPRDKVSELIETVRLNIEHGQTHDETMKRVALLIE